MSFPQKNTLVREVVTLAAGEAKNFPAQLMAKMSVQAGTGATVLWSRVNSMAATAHGTLAGAVITPPAAGDLATIAVDWPYYRVSTASGPATVALV